MKQNYTVKYTIEREFLSKISVEELMIHIIRAHIQKEKGKDTLT